MPEAGRLRRIAPEWAERLREALAAGREAWLFLDELSCAPPGMQAALLRLTQERRLGDCDLRGVRVLAAANPADQAAGGIDLSPATLNRWAHLDWLVDHEAWCRGLLSGWGITPPDSEARARRQIAGWIRRRPQALLQPHATDRAWPSPRSWHALARVLAQGGDVGAVASSLVGAAAAAEFASWLAEYDLPDPEDVLRTGKLPAKLRADVAAACLDAVIVAACAPRRDRTARYLRAWEVLRTLRIDAQISPAKYLLDQERSEITLPDYVIELAERVRGAQS